MCMTQNGMTNNFLPASGKVGVSGVATSISSALADRRCACQGRDLRSRLEKGQAGAGAARIGWGWGKLLNVESMM